VRSRHAAFEIVASNLASVGALLLLGAWSVPSFGSSGLTVDCHESRAELPNLEVPMEPLSAGPLDLAPPGKAVLQREFEDDDDSLTTSSDLKPLDTPNTPPLASTKTTPTQDTHNSSSRSENVGTRSTEGSIDETTIPGITDVDLLRFRDQMFRTDI